MTNSPPNVLLLFTDMQRADTIAALGNPVIRTPSLDRLAREGVAFTNAFTPSPVCVPARWCMHYGRYATKSGLFANGRMPDDDGRSLPAVLGRAGYRTQGVGKCHFTGGHVVVTKSGLLPGSSSAKPLSSSLSRVTFASRIS